MRQAANTATRAISVEISGEEYADLQRMADAMNSVGWCDNDNTPESIVKYFLLVTGSYRDMCDGVLSGIDTGVEADTPQERERINELAAAFIAFSQGGGGANNSGYDIIPLRPSV